MSKRLAILSKAEQQELYGLPDFTDTERESYFTLEPHEASAMAAYSSVRAAVCFVLQLGYFKCKARFFAVQLSQIRNDIRYILAQYFPQAKFLPSIVAKKTWWQQQAQILQLCAYQAFELKHQQTLLDHLSQEVKIWGEPQYLFEKVLDFCQGKQVVVPAYSTLQDLVGKSLSNEARRLQKLITTHLSPAAAQALEAMLQDQEQKMYGVTLLKRDAKGFNYAELAKEIDKHQASIALFKDAKMLIPQLDLSEQNIRYYAYLVDYYTVDRLNELADDPVKLYLLCYIYYRFERINDNSLTGKPLV